MASTNFHSSQGSFDVIKAIRQYCTEATDMVKGMKVLLLDHETTSIISLVFGQMEILQREVYLFEKMSTNNREVMPYLQAICFLSPSEQNLNYIEKEIQNPKYGAYYIFFTNTVSESYLKKLAEADEFELVKEVHEFYADYCAINPDTWTLNITGPGLLDSSCSSWPSHLSRITDGVAAMLLSLKIRPNVRYQRSSNLALQIANAIKMRIKNSSTFHLGQTKSEKPLLIIMDRNEDPITPLLTSWTYQSMCHQLIGISNNRLDLSHVAGLSKELHHVVLSTLQDDFFVNHMYDDFGDLGVEIKKLADNLQNETQTHSKLESIDDIKRFLDNYPEFRKTTGEVSKHVAIVSELYLQVHIRRLLDISPVEQKLACHQDMSNATESVRSLLISEPKISCDDALRIVLLYSLRYATSASTELQKFVRILSQRFEISDQRLGIIHLLLQYADKHRRTGQLDLFENQDWLTSVRGKIKRGLIGITNVFTQHNPLLKKILVLLQENALDTMAYPFLLGERTKAPPRQVLIFIVGGATFQEAALIHRMNKEEKGFQYLLGSTSMTDPNQFMNELLETSKSFR